MIEREAQRIEFHQQPQLENPIDFSNFRQTPSIFARNIKILPLNEDSQYVKGLLLEDKKGDQKLDLNKAMIIQQKTFLISSVQPSLKVKKMLMKVLEKRRLGEKSIVKQPHSVIKMSILYVEKFIRLLKQQSSAIRFRQCGQNQLNIIGDKSVDYKYYLLKRYFDKESPSFVALISEYIEYLKIYRWIKQNVIVRWKLDSIQCLILPNSKIYMIWTVSLLLVISLNVLYIPMQISFNDISLSPFANVCLNTLPNFCFIIEILLKFNTAIYKKGLIIKSRKEIILSYLQKRFWYDIIIVLGFLMGSYLQNGYIQSALLLRYFDIVELISNLVDRYNLRERFYGIIDLAKLIFFILFIAHLCGCIWHYIAISERNKGTQHTWLSQGTITYTDSWQVRYITSLYWSVVTMCTLGYGDIVPLTPTEKMFSITVTLISCFVFGYSVNQIGDILKEFFRIEEEFKVKMAKLNIYMKKRELNDDVSVKVRKYFEYLHKEELQQNSEGAILIDSLEKDLKSEVLKDIYGKLLRSKKLFMLNFNIDNLSVKMKEKTIGLHEYVYKEGDSSEYIYFLLRGQLEVIKSQTNTTFQNIEKGMMLGEIEFFTGQMRQFTIRANSVAQLAYFSKEDFLEVIQKSSTDFEKFKQMQDQIHIYLDTRGMDHQCGSCGKYTHLLLSCPQINLQLNKSKTLQKYTLSTIQERKQDIKRMSIKQSGGMHKIKLVQQMAETFKINEKIQISKLQLEDSTSSESSEENIKRSLSAEDLNIKKDDKTNEEQIEQTLHSSLSEIEQVLKGEQNILQKLSFQEEFDEIKERDADISYKVTYQSHMKLSNLLNNKKRKNEEDKIDNNTDYILPFTTENSLNQFYKSQPSIDQNNIISNINAIEFNEIPKSSSLFTLPSLDTLTEDEIIGQSIEKLPKQCKRQEELNEQIHKKAIVKVQNSSLRKSQQEQQNKYSNSLSTKKQSKKETENLESNQQKKEQLIGQEVLFQSEPKMNLFNSRKKNENSQNEIENKKKKCYNYQLKNRNQNSLLQRSSTISEQRRKVSVIVSKPGSSEVSLTLSVNEKEKKQLQEVLDLEENFNNQQNKLKKTLGIKKSCQQVTPNKRIDEEDEDKYPQSSGKPKMSQGQFPLDKEEIIRVQTFNGLHTPLYCGRNSSYNRISLLPQDGHVQVQQLSEGEKFELKKYDRIYLKHYDDDFISQFEGIREYEEYFCKNNCSSVLDMISIRRKINPFYRELLIKKKQSSKSRSQPRNHFQKRKNFPLRTIQHSSQIGSLSSRKNFMQASVFSQKGSQQNSLFLSQLNSQ